MFKQWFGIKVKVTELPSHRKQLITTTRTLRQYSKHAEAIELPIFSGTVSHTLQYDPKVEAGLLKIAKEDPNVHVIDMQAHIA